MQHGLVADGHAGTDAQRVAGVGMQHRALLHVAALAEHHRLVVSAQHGAVPHAGLRAQLDTPDHASRVGDEGVGGDLRAYLAQSKNTHGKSLP